MENDLPNTETVHQSVQIVGCNFTNNIVSAQAMLSLAYGSYDLLIKSSYFVDNVVAAGGLVRIYNSNYAVKIQNSSFISNSGWSGTVLSSIVDLALTLQQAVLVSSSTFIGNTAKNGGSVMSSWMSAGTVDLSVTVSKTQFTNNVAMAWSRWDLAPGKFLVDFNFMDGMKCNLKLFHLHVH